MNLTLADKVTISRLLLLPVAVVFYLLGTDLGYYLCALFVVIIAAGDFLDGMIARRMGQETSFGAFLDPVADKLMVCTVVIILIDLDRVNVIFGIIINELNSRFLYRSIYIYRTSLIHFYSFI